MTGSIKEILAEDGSQARNVVSWRVPHATLAVEKEDKQPTQKCPSPLPPRPPQHQTTHQSLPSQKLMSYLFRTAKIAIAELYAQCEEGGGTEDTAEAGRLLSNCARQFNSLAERQGGDGSAAGIIKFHAEEKSPVVSSNPQMAPVHMSSEAFHEEDLGEVLEVGEHHEGGEEEEEEEEEEQEAQEEEAENLATEEEAYAEAAEAIWAEAEAWVDAEARAEDEAWALLQQNGDEGTSRTEVGSAGGLHDLCITIPSRDSALDSDHAQMTSWLETVSSDDEGLDMMENSPSFASPSLAEMQQGRPAIHFKLLSSPDRKRLTPAEAKLRHDRRQRTAELNRAQITRGRQTKLRIRDERARDVRLRQDKMRVQVERDIKVRMNEAGARRAAYMQRVIAKANDENSKVDEVLFINKLTVEDFKITIQQRLGEVEERIEDGRERRRQLLMGIAANCRTRNRAKARQMSERQLEMQRAASDRWQNLQQRLEDVQRRRQERLKLRCDLASAAASRTPRTPSPSPSLKKAPGGADGKPVVHRSSKGKGKGKGGRGGKGGKGLVSAEEEPIATALAATNGIGGSQLLDHRTIPMISKAARKKVKKARVHMMEVALPWESVSRPPTAESSTVGAPASVRARILLAQLPQAPDDYVEWVDAKGSAAAREISRFSDGLREKGEAELRSVRTSGLLVSLLDLCVPLRGSIAETDVAAAALGLVLTALHLPENRDFMLCREGRGGSTLADAVAWALAQRVLLPPTANIPKVPRGLDAVLPVSASGVLGVALPSLSLMLRHVPEEASLASSQEYLLRYTLSTGCLRGCAALLSDLQPHCDELLSGGSKSLVLVRITWGVLDAIVHFPKARAAAQDVTYSIIEGLKGSGAAVAPASLMASLVIASTTVPSGVTPSIPPEVLSLSSVVLHALNGVGSLSLSLLQDALATDGITGEFQATCSRLLAAFTLALDEGNGEAEQWLAELLALIGQYALRNEKNQNALHWGSSPTVLVRLCTLPFRYYSEEEYRAILFPTLLAACYGNPRNREVVREELSLDLLADYLVQAQTSDSVLEPAAMVVLQQRFPPDLWAEALPFFQG